MTSFDDKVVSNLSQNCLKVVSKLSQIFLKVVSNLSQKNETTLRILGRRITQPLNPSILLL